MKIVNVMVRCKFDRPLNPHWLAQRLPNVEYEPRRLPALRLRIKRPVRATFLLYESGSVICTGPRGVVEARQACRRLQRLVRRLLPTATIREFKILNLVACANVGRCVDLEALTTRLANPRRARFNPELFAGAVYTSLIHPRVHALVFHNGKLIITGARVVDELEEVLAEVIKVITVESYT